MIHRLRDNVLVERSGVITLHMVHNIRQHRSVWTFRASDAGGSRAIPTSRRIHTEPQTSAEGANKRLLTNARVESDRAASPVVPLLEFHIRCMEFTSLLNGCRRNCWDVTIRPVYLLLPARGPTCLWNANASDANNFLQLPKTDRVSFEKREMKENYDSTCILYLYQLLFCRQLSIILIKYCTYFVRILYIVFYILLLLLKHFCSKFKRSCFPLLFGQCIIRFNFRISLAFVFAWYY